MYEAPSLECWKWHVQSFNLHLYRSRYQFISLDQWPRKIDTLLGCINPRLSIKEGFWSNGNYVQCLFNYWSFRLLQTGSQEVVAIALTPTVAPWHSGDKFKSFKKARALSFQPICTGAHSDLGMTWMVSRESNKFNGSRCDLGFVDLFRSCACHRERHFDWRLV